MKVLNMKKWWNLYEYTKKSRYTHSRFPHQLRYSIASLNQEDISPKT